MLTTTITIFKFNNTRHCCYTDTFCSDIAMIKISRLAMYYNRKQAIRLYTMHWSTLIVTDTDLTVYIVYSDTMSVSSLDGKFLFHSRCILQINPRKQTAFNSTTTD